MRDVSSFKQAVSESGIRDVTVIADKGFGSAANFEMLENAHIRYIVPLRRNNGAFDRAKLKSGDKSSFDGHFIFQKRIIWYYEYVIDGARYIVFQDGDLRMEEEKDYLQRVEAQHEGYTMEGYLEKQYDFGTIPFRTNRTDSPEEIYKLYKTKSPKGKSIIFSMVIILGYIFGIANKYISDDVNYVVFFYFFDK